MVTFLISLFGYNIDYPWSVGACSGYLIYVLLGYIIVNNEINIGAEVVVYLLGIVGLVAHVFGTYYFSMNAGEIVQTFKGYTNVPCLLYSVAIFVFVKKVGRLLMTRKRINIIVNKLSEYTFSIYLLHVYLLQSFIKLGCNPLSIYFRIIAPLIVIPISVLIAKIIRKVPKGRVLLP